MNEWFNDSNNCFHYAQKCFTIVKLWCWNWKYNEIDFVSSFNFSFSFYFLIFFHYFHFFLHDIFFINTTMSCNTKFWISKTCFWHDLTRFWNFYHVVNFTYVEKWSKFFVTIKRIFSFNTTKWMISNFNYRKID